MKKNTQKAEGLLFIEAMLKIRDIEYVKEYRFCERMYRFDIAIPSLKIAIEFEGIGGAKSRHLQLVGYTNDCTKYNLAITHGWRVLRYTSLNYKEVGNSLSVLFPRN